MRTITRLALAGAVLGAAAGAAALARPEREPVAAAARPVSVTVALSGRRRPELRRLLDGGRSVTAAAYGDRFGPAPAEARRVVDELERHGLTADWHAGDPFVVARGAAAAVARLPRSLGTVTAGEGRVRRLAIRPGGVEPGDMLSFYDVRRLHDAGLDGEGQTIVLPEIDDVPSPDDLNAYADRYGLPPFDVEFRRDPSWGDPTDRGTPGGESMLDLEIIHAIAPKAKLVVYFAAPDFGSLLRAEAAMVREHPGAIISESLGACEPGVPAAAREQWAALNARAAAQGMSHFVASGDSGAFTCGEKYGPTTSFPATLPTVTSVGGTSVFATADGSYGKETAWGNAIGRDGAGGGVSMFYGRPSWQTGSGVQQAGSNGRRQVPDVGGLADGNTGWHIIVGGRDAQIGGTSAAAPLWAGITALIDQHLEAKGLARIGFANPGIYWIGRHQKELAAAPFHDVTAGNNLHYHAGPGWDFVTGWGTPDAGALVDAWVAYQRRGR